MADPYITFWNQAQLEVDRRNQADAKDDTLHFAGNRQYRKAGVRRGDRVYVLATRGGRIVLVGRMVVEAVVSRRVAEQRLGHEVFPAPDQILGTGTPIDLDRIVPEKVARQITRASGKPLKIAPDRYAVEPQSLRSTGRITEESAALLDALLDDAVEVALEAAQALPEGGRRTVNHQTVERSARVRAEALRIHGTTCQVCGFSFRDRYGRLGEGVAEVHHLRSLAAAGGSVLVDPAKDVAVVCANCHRMLHKGVDEPRTIAALQRIVARRARVAAG